MCYKITHVSDKKNVDNIRLEVSIIINYHMTSRLGVK